MPIMSTRARRWAVPGVVAGVIAAGVGGTVLSADAAPSLPPKSASELLVALQQADPEGVSGTVVQTADLGLPRLPTGPNGRGSSDLRSLITGTHTLRVWYASDQQVRVALLGTLGESDVIRNGKDLWTWSSSTNTATHTTLPDSDGHGAKGPADVPLTPQEAAELALKALGPTTEIGTDGTARIAGRSAYELVLAPKEDRSLVSQVRLAIDSKTSVPLRVQVYGKDGSQPAFEIGFTHVSFGPQDEQQFRFTPPPGAEVKETGADGSDSRAEGGMPRLRVLGESWTTVLVIDDVKLGEPADPQDAEDAEDADLLGTVFSHLEKVSGPWGSGRMLKSTLLTALLTDDGRMFVGPVTPEAILQAAAQR